MVAGKQTKCWMEPEGWPSSAAAWRPVTFWPAPLWCRLPTSWAKRIRTAERHPCRFDENAPFNDDERGRRALERGLECGCSRPHSALWARSSFQ